MNDDITNTPAETRRDRWGRYLIVPPTGGKPVGYTRATTVAKALDDTSSLMAWGERMTAIGLSDRPDLLAQVHEARNDKTALNRLCERAKEAGGATVRRDLGIALHSMLEQSFNDPSYEPPAAHKADVEAVHAQLAAAGLEVVAGMTERVVVLDEHTIAGTFDLMLRVISTGELLIGDIKTGSSVEYGALGFCVQLSLYAHADSLYVQGEAADGSQDQREPMPTVSKQHAVIIHVEPGSGLCTIHQLQLHWWLAEMAIDVRSSRSMKGLLQPWQTPLEALLEARNVWIRDRIAACTEANKKLLAAHWPTSILPPKKAKQYTTAEIDDLDVVLGRVERELDIAWPTPDPRIATITISKGTMPEASQEPPEGAVGPAEGVEQPDQRQRLKDVYDGLDEDAKSWIAARVWEAADAQLPIRVAEHPSQRRIAIADSMFAALARQLDDDTIRQMIAAVLGDDTVTLPSVTLGAALGCLDHRQAAALAELTNITQGATNVIR
jgi:hypothetical protein